MEKKLSANGMRGMRFAQALVLVAVLCAWSGSGWALSIGTFTPSGAPVGNPAIYNTLYNVEILGGDVGKYFSVDWLLPTTYTGLSDELSANALITIDDFTASELTLTVKLTNSTTSAVQAGWTAFGFSVTPDGTAAYSDAGSKFDGVESGSGPNQTFPGGYKLIDVCAYAADNCGGGNISDGLQSGGNTDTFTLTISGSFSGEDGLKVVLDSFPAKFQTAAGSFEIAGTTTTVPVPAAALLLGSGLVGLAGLRRRRTQR